MKFILILIIQAIPVQGVPFSPRDGFAIATAEFNSFDACREVGRTYLNLAKSETAGFRVISATCSAKGAESLPSAPTPSIRKAIG